MLRLFSHPVACCCELLGAVAQGLKSVKLLAMYKEVPTMLGVVGQQCCVRLQGALLNWNIASI